jgi:exosortase E/protease (VPEID-CTERM system)
MPTIILVTWILFRVIGTIALVPIIEELFFRGYILERLDRGGLTWKLAALGLSTGLFAVLHDRWALAAIAGLAYGLLYLRSRNLTDAIVAHATSNLVISVYAVSTSRWWVI